MAKQRKGERQRIVAALRRPRTKNFLDHALMRIIQAMSPPLTQDELEQLADFRYRLRQFLRVSETMVHAHGCTAQQYQLLLQLLGYPGRRWASVAELAERLQSQHHGVVALVTRCEQAGWVQRRASRGDKRCVEIHLTPAGRTLGRQLARLHRDELGALRAGRALSNATAPKPTAP